MATLAHSREPAVRHATNEFRLETIDGCETLRLEELPKKGARSYANIASITVQRFARIGIQDHPMFLDHRSPY
jgi:hypothetical protein